MTISRELEPLAKALEALSRWFQSEKVEWAIVGGVAASLLGRPRMTRDIDAVVLVDDLGWDRFLESGRPFGFSGRIEDLIEFAHRTRVLLLRHDPSGIQQSRFAARTKRCFAPHSKALQCMTSEPIFG